MTRAQTREKILRCFMRLATAKGIDATSARLVAEAAGVSELTGFRHFGDKATLAREAVRLVAPRAALLALQPAIDTSTPAATVRGLARCLQALRDRAWDNRALMQFAMAEAHRHPELMAAPTLASAITGRALAQAAPMLRDDVDLDAAHLCLQGLLHVTVSWSSVGWMRLGLRRWNQLIVTAVRPLVRDRGRRRP